MPKGLNFLQFPTSSKPPSELPMINPTDSPTDQQIHCFKPTINRSQPTDPNPARRSTTNDPNIRPNREGREKEEKKEMLFGSE